jgi:DNA ligase (NAD+)
VLEEHNRRYYLLDAPSVSDAEYDALFRELLALEQRHPELRTPSSPSQRVGTTPREGLVKIKRAVRMYSLDNAYSRDDLLEFDRRVRESLEQDAPRYIAEPKLDGASIEVTYERGALALASTRGDGETGEDVTANVRTIRSLPLTIPFDGKLTLRGEVVIHRKDLARINERRKARDEEPFANPRNAAAGSLRLIDPKLTAERPLRVIFYDAVEPITDTHHALLEQLATWGLPTHEQQKLCTGVDEVLSFVDGFQHQRENLPYDTDGVVLKLDQRDERSQLGFTSRFPRWAIAYKYAAEQKQTRVLKITADVGRTGTLTPVADLEPIQLSGTTVSRASLHNLDYIQSKDVRVGDLVLVEKAGEIIPQVIAVIHEARPELTVPWSPPTRCPVCNTLARRIEGEAALRCPNPACPGRLKAALFYFTRRASMDIDGLGKSLIDQLVDQGLVTDLADIFALSQKREELLALPRMAAKSVDNLLASIEQARTTRGFERLVAGLGIPLVGGVAARLIAERFADLDALLAIAAQALGEQLATIDGIGPKIAESVAGFVGNPEHRSTLQKLRSLGVTTVSAQRVRREGPLSGTSFCVTGQLSLSREQIHAEIVALGGEAHTSVKKGTTYLVTGDKVGRAKIEAAEKKGAKVIDEAALRILMRG